MARELREECLYMAKLAHQANRYHEVVEPIETIVHEFIAAAGGELTDEERDLLSHAYKQLTRSLRDACLIMSSMKPAKKANEATTTVYKSKLERELSEYCFRILKILNDHLIPSARMSNSKVFYMKMKGDYYRYLAEIKSNNEKKQAVEYSMAAYHAARDVAVADLGPTHPLRLGVCLNLSVFYYEILKEPEKARGFAKQALEEAIDDIEALAEEHYKDCNDIMQILRENLTLWSPDE